MDIKNIKSKIEKAEKELNFLKRNLDTIHGEKAEIFFKDFNGNIKEIKKYIYKEKHDFIDRFLEKLKKDSKLARNLIEEGVEFSFKENKGKIACLLRLNGGIKRIFLLKEDIEDFLNDIIDSEFFELAIEEDIVGDEFVENHVTCVDKEGNLVVYRMLHPKSSIVLEKEEGEIHFSMLNEVLLVTRIPFELSLFLDKSKLDRTLKVVLSKLDKLEADMNKLSDKENQNTLEV